MAQLLHFLHFVTEDGSYREYIVIQEDEEMTPDDYRLPGFTLRLCEELDFDVTSLPTDRPLIAGSP